MRKKLKKKLTPDVSLKLRLQCDHLIEADKESEMDEQVGENVRPLEFSPEGNFICRHVVVMFMLARHDVFDNFSVFRFRSPK